MQTFLPYPDFRRTAQVLDRQRLGKQRLEGWQILKCLLGLGCNGWKNHPAVKMWRGHEGVLFQYVATICYEWIMRGYRDSILIQISEVKDSFTVLSYITPVWLGDEDFHRAHRSNLLRKDPDHYRLVWPDEPDDLPYIWPEGDETQIGVLIGEQSWGVFSEKIVPRRMKDEDLEVVQE